MRGMHDVADFTSSLVEWTSELLPAQNVRPGSAQCSDPAERKRQPDLVLVRLAAVEGVNGPRSREAVAHRLTLEYSFDLFIDDAVAEHQAMADLAFALLERTDLAEGQEIIRGQGASLSARFALDRRRDLPRAKPVRERVFNLHANLWIRGCVVADDQMPLSRARVHVLGTDNLIIADENGAFAFAAPEGAAVRARVSAKGRAAEIELKPDKPNVITLAMER